MGMKLTGLDVFDSTIQTTNAWLKELMLELNWSDRRKAYLALRAVLHGLRDSLSARDAVYLGEQLPALLRGFYFDHWDPGKPPLAVGSRAEFFSKIAANLGRAAEYTWNPEVIVRAVFRLLERKAADGEIDDIHHILPHSLVDLWPPTLRAA